MTILTLGIDLAKNVFAVHGVNEAGKPALVRPEVRRNKLVELIASLPPCLIGMEACSGAHHWAREFEKLGHTVRLMAPKFVAPYRIAGKRGKNDANDAAAICEAVTRPQMRFVPVKSIEQPTTVRREAHKVLEDLPGWCNIVIGDLLGEVTRLDGRIAEYDAHVRHMAQHNDRARRLMQLAGAGATTASAIVASVGNGLDFKSSSQFSAWLGFRPRLTARCVFFLRQEQSLPATKAQRMSYPTEPLRTARRSARRVAPPSARKARSRSGSAIDSRQAAPRLGAVAPAGRRLASAAKVKAGNPHEHVDDPIAVFICPSREATKSNWKASTRPQLTAPMMASAQAIQSTT